MNSTIKQVNVERGNSGLGFILSSQKPCVISSVNQNGPAEKAGLLPGDELLEVNSIDVSTLKHDEVIKHILNYDSIRIKLKVRTVINNIKLHHTNGSKSPDIQKRNFLNKVIKDIRSSAGFNGFHSPVSIPKQTEHYNKNNKENISGDKKLEKASTPHNRRSAMNRNGKYNIDHLSNRRRVNENDYNDTLSKRRPLSQIYTKFNRTERFLSDNSDNRNQNVPSITRPKLLSSLFGVKSFNHDEEDPENDVFKSNTTPNRLGNKKSIVKRKTLVYYYSSTELPKSANILATSLDTLNKCVAKIKNDYSKQKSGMVLLTISNYGVKLSNISGNEIITYPLKTLVFSGVCSIDRRFFGLVTKKNFLDRSQSLSSSFSQSPNNMEGKTLVLCSCHVFMIDPKLMQHENHSDAATLFSIKCTPSSKFDGCEEFPDTPSYILQELNSLYTERASSRPSSFSSTGSSLSSSTSQSALTEKIVITNTIDRMRDNFLNHTPKDTKKLMNEPPSSLKKLDEEEKKELLKELQTELDFTSETTKSSDVSQESLLSERTGRRKSAPDTSIDVFIDSPTKRKETSKALLNGSSLRIGNKKPPLLKKNHSVPRKMVELTGETERTISAQQNFFSGFRRVNRRKSESSALSPNINFKDILKGSLGRKCVKVCSKLATKVLDRSSKLVQIRSEFIRRTPPVAASGRMPCETKAIAKQEIENSCKKLHDTPQTIARHESKKDTNENVRSLSNHTSDISIDINGRVERWAQSFENLLADPVGLRCFQEFLRKEFSEENVLFWAACESFKKTKTIDKMKFHAGDIFRNYLSPKAAFLVNVDQAAVKKVEENLNTPHQDMFNTPQNQVFHLMKFDSYNRFLKSELYLECVQCENQDKLLPFEDEVEEDNRRKHGQFKKSKSTNIQQENSDKKKNLLNFLSKGNGRVGKVPENEKLRKERSSSLSAVEEFCRKNTIMSSPESNGYATSKDSQLWDGLQSKTSCSFVRVQLPDGTSTMIVAEKGQTIRQSLKSVCDQKNIDLKSFDITVGESRQVTNPDTDITTFQDNVINLEKRVLFRFDLPNGRSVGIKAHPSKTLGDVLFPVMKKNRFDLEDFSIYVVGIRESLQMNINVVSVENKRLITKPLSKKLERHQAESTKPPLQEFRASFRRLRAGSFKDDKNKTERTHNYSTLDRDNRKMEDETLSRKISAEMRHLILGRTKSADDDALMTVLRKSQSGRLDDQRGMLSKDIELPDFLKITAGTPSPVRNTFKTTTAVIKTESVPKYPASPVIVDSEQFDDDAEDVFLNSTAISDRPSLFSVRSWKEMSSPERNLIDSDFISQDYISASFNTTLSHDTIESRDTLKEISKHRSIKLLKKQNLCKENSAPPKLNGLMSGYTQELIDGDIQFHSEPLVGLKRSNSCDNKLFESTFHEDNTNVKNNRPQPISTFNESDILRELDSKDHTIVNISEPFPREELPSHTLNKFSNFTPSTPLNNIVPKSNSCNGVVITTTDTKLSLEISKSYSTADRLESVNIINYDMSPRANQANRSLSFPVTAVSQANETKVTTTTSNSFQISDKEKLLHGETIRGKQNEKITFV